MSENAPVAALTKPPPARVDRNGLVWPPPPSEAHFKKTPTPWLTVAIIGAMVAGVVLGAATEVPQLAGASVIAAVIGAVYTLRTSVRRSNALLGKANTLVAERKLADAERILDELARHPRGNAQVHTLALLQLAGVRGLRGDLEGALALECHVQGKRKNALRMHVVISESLPFQIARHYALLGERDAAERWLQFARKKRNFLQPHAGDVVEAMLRAREGRFGDAVTIYERIWTMLENSTTADAMKAHRLVYALCLAGLGRDDKKIEQLVGGAIPFGAEVTAVASAWPELRAFVRERAPGETLPE